jgi:hypothetical protein
MSVGCPMADSLCDQFNDAVIDQINPKVVDPNELTEEEKTILMEKGKISAIKELRTRTGLGLLDAKLTVERYMDDNCLTWSPTLQKIIKS